MKTRKYQAYCDNGHEYFTFEFKSVHRAKSKANYDDAKRHARQVGYKMVKIINTELYPYY